MPSFWAHLGPPDVIAAVALALIPIAFIVTMPRVATTICFGIARHLEPLTSEPQTSLYKGGMAGFLSILAFRMDLPLIKSLTICEMSSTWHGKSCMSNPHENFQLVLNGLSWASSCFHLLCAVCNRWAPARELLLLSLSLSLCIYIYTHIDIYIYININKQIKIFIYTYIYIHAYILSIGCR